MPQHTLELVSCIEREMQAEEGRGGEGSWEEGRGVGKRGGELGREEGSWEEGRGVGKRRVIKMRGWEKGEGRGGELGGGEGKVSEMR